MNWTLKTGPTAHVVELDTVKRQCRIEIEQADEDALLDVYLGAAERWVEQYTGRALLTQTWQASVHEFPDTWWLPRAAPLQSVTFVRYYDTANVLQTLSSSVYTVPAFSEPAIIRLAYARTWPSVYEREDAVQVEYVCGWADASSVPAALAQAVLMLTAEFYRTREVSIVGTSSTPTQMAAEALCAPYRVWSRHPEFVK